MSRHEVYGYEKLICYGSKCISYHIFKGPSTEQDDENSRSCHSASHRKYKHFAILWPFMLADLQNVLQNTSKGHWKVKIISLAAEGT